MAAANDLHEAFRALFEAECAYVVNALRRLGVPPSDCADVAHEVFLIVLRKLPECDRTRPMRPWLFAIAYRVARDYRRTSVVRHETPMEISPTDASLTPEEAVRAGRRRRLVLDALDAVDPQRRPIFVMHDIEGHGMPDIADALGLPLNTAYSRLRLARAEFTAFVRRRAREYDG